MRHSRCDSLLFLLLLSAFAGCGDDPTESPPDARVPTPPTADGALEVPDAAEPEPEPEPGPVVVPVSTTGHDRFCGVAFAPDDSFYAVGNVAVSTDSAADFAFVVARFQADGTLDPAFGAGGFAVKNVAVGTSGELARGVVVQASGKVVVSGTVEHVGAADARDRDVALLRFDQHGVLDPSFGQNGVVLLDLSAGEAVGTGFVADSIWGLARSADDKLILSAAQKRAGGTDSDFAVVRLTADGALDPSFGAGGVATLDINHANASPRAATVLADGSVLATGYMNEAGVTRPVVFKLDSSGQLVPGFGQGGVFSQPVLAASTEVYGAVVQGDKLITAGYGRAAANESLDWVSLRLDASGALDPTWGQSGVVRVDVAGFNDNARNLVALDDGRVLVIGGGRPSDANVDGMIALLGRDGALDTTWSPTGYRLFDLGGASDFFWSIAVAPSKTHLVVVGVKGVGQSPGNDDAVVLKLPLP
jgi:uncharacterized delta-60 repeat protein